MNRLILALALCIGLTACGGKGSGKSDPATEVQPQETKDRVEILYFHGKKRCATCLAIERNTKEAVEARFADALKNGTVVFKVIDLSDAENDKIAEKYEVTWSSLFLSKWKNGQETYENLTEYAFANARTAPDTFKNGVVEKIDQLLK